MNLELDGKRVLVTGSSRGIGLAVAEVFLEEGASVALNGRDERALDDVRGLLVQRFGSQRVTSVVGDLADDEDVVERSLESAVAALGGLDVLVANVGGGRGAGGMEADQDEWIRMLRLNLVSGAIAARQSIPHLRRNGGGSIVFIGSIAGLTALPAPLPYGAAKAGLNALTVNLATTHASDGIRVNLIAPGNVIHDGSTWQRKLEADPEGTRLYVEENVPLARFGRPEEIGRAAAFLASDRTAGFITGAVLVVDGGQRGAW